MIKLLLKFPSLSRIPLALPAIFFFFFHVPFSPSAGKSSLFGCLSKFFAILLNLSTPFPFYSCHARPLMIKPLRNSPLSTQTSVFKTGRQSTHYTSFFSPERSSKGFFGFVMETLRTDDFLLFHFFFPPQRSPPEMPHPILNNPPKLLKDMISFFQTLPS